MGKEDGNKWLTTVIKRSNKGLIIVLKSSRNLEIRLSGVG
jgi:hypothetical protein